MEELTAAPQTGSADLPLVRSWLVVEWIAFGSLVAVVLSAGAVIRFVAAAA